MDGSQRPAERTIVTPYEYAHAVVIAWPKMLGGKPTDPACAVLWSQYMIETGGRNCWNWNIGNVKKRDGDGYDWHALHGVWEGVSPDASKRLIASGEASPDPSADHSKAVGPNRVSVLYNPPHPATRFRAYPNLAKAMEHHIEFLALGRYASCWPFVVAGDVKGFSAALHAAGYFTASRDAYAAGMARPYGPFLASDAFELAEAQEALPKPARTLDFQAYDRATRPIVDDEDPSEPDPAA